MELKTVPLKDIHPYEKNPRKNDGAVDDCENIAKLCINKKFWSASSAVKEATLCKYFDMDRLFGAFTPETLPSRYLRSYAQVEKLWGKTPLEVAVNQ